MSKVSADVRQLVEPTINSMGFQLFDLEYVKEGKQNYLRIYIDNEAGVTLDDCVAVSEAISPILDDADPDPIPTAYFLEVSSPGAERPLKNEAAIEQAIGEYVHLNFYAAVDGEKFLEGRLQAVTPDQFTLEVKDKMRLREVPIDRTNVSLIRLAIEF
ncbi:MAG: ribosome maturation factor RimP [Aerococcus sp.]|nr:ribosome maturation factor RimP [Aerococcus sp.]